MQFCKPLFLLPLAAASTLTFAHVGTQRSDGIRNQPPRWHAVTGAKLVVAPGRVIDNGTLVIEDGRIVASAVDVAVPKGARVWHLPGRAVSAGFIDLPSSIGLP